MRRLLPVAVALALFSAMLLLPTPAMAQNVTLNPATIQGTLEVTGQTLSPAYVYANWTDNSTNPPTYYSASAAANGNSYTLVVNVPQGSTPTYTMSAYGYLSGTSQTFYFDPQDVNPDPLTPQTVNFSVNPGVIQGTVTSTGAPLSSYYVYAGNSSSYFTSNTYSLIVKPGLQTYVYGYGYGQYGYASLSPSYQYVDVAAGQTVSGVDWTINLPSAPPTGSIAGAFSFSGNVTPNYVSVAASGQTYSNQQVTGNSYSIPDLYAGGYYMYGSASFPNGAYLSFPDGFFLPSRSATVSGGITTTVDISGVQTYLNGAITLVGTNTLADTSSSSMSVYGISAGASGGSGGAQLPSNGAYSFVLSEGSWSAPNLNLYFSKTADPADYLYEQLYVSDYQHASNGVTLAAGETATKNLTYATGKITVNFQALGNATFSYPTLSASCSYLDPVTHQTKWNYSAYAYNNSLINVTDGGVTFVGLAGTCQIQASAYVNGTNYVTFGYLTATVVPGVVIVIDIGGPSLTVTAPAANAVSSSATVTVTGTADDDVVDIASITVNGNAATFTSTNNAARPHEVSFTANVPLSLGANTLATVVTALPTDVPAKSASDTRTVYYLAAPTVTAAGGTFTYSASPHAGSGSATGGHGQSLAVTLSYSGTGATSYGPSASAPTNAGTYQVVAHTDGDADTLSGDSAPAALIINKANASIIVGGYHLTFDGASHTAIGSAKGVLLENLSGLDLSATVHTAVGSYDDPWTFTDVTGNYNDAAGTVHSDIEAESGSLDVCGVDMPKGPKQSGSTIPIKLQVCDAPGHVSTTEVVVHATGIQLVSGTTNGTLQDSGNANPGMNFRVVGPPSAYMFNLQTKGFATGTYNLLFTIGSDPTVHAVSFQIK